MQNHEYITMYYNRTSCIDGKKNDHKGFKQDYWINLKTNSTIRNKPKMSFIIF